MSESWPAGKVEYRPTADLRPYENNARTHSIEQVAQLMASIREWGFTQPILIDEAGVVLAGHGRLLAADRLKLDRVPVVVARGWTDQQKRAYALADNKLALNAGWDDELLAAELIALQDSNFDLELIGFSSGELDEILLSGESAADDEEDKPVPATPIDPVARLGDVWVCGEHRVLCGDATVLANVELVLCGNRADMVFCDPPYGVKYVGKTSEKLTIVKDSADGLETLLYDACVNIFAVTGGAVYICSAGRWIAGLQSAFRRAGGKWSTYIIWAKNTFTLGGSDYQSQHELILYGWKDGADHYWCGARDQGDVWFFNKPHKNDLHPTMKPVALVERAIRNSSRRGDIVLDPFGGSGTTMIAAENAGRRARLIELDPKYVDVIVKRWQDHTGKVAVRESDMVPALAESAA